MTLSEFQRLCQDQWMAPERGDVAKLWLTSESAAQLVDDILTARDGERYVSTQLTHAQAALIRAGFAITKIINPVTRSDVAVTAGNPSDTAVVSLGGYAPDKLVPL
jgi:exopolyphosphatase/pppGpp-phosphohydrolase